MNRIAIAALVAAASAPGLLAPAAVAGPLDSVRLGVMDHNIEVTDGKNAEKESGFNVNGELVFKSPEFLGVVWSPRPWVMASVNTDGNTSYAGAGLVWDWEFMKGWHVEPGFGYVVHSGELNNPFPAGSAQAVAFSSDRVLLGSRDLFRSSLALTLDINENWAVQGVFEHLSHGQILGSGRNQGLDELGVRLVYNFR